MFAYELWETTSGNLMASFDTEVEALAAVSNRAKLHGPASIATVTLVRVDDEDEDADIVTLASGVKLLSLTTPTTQDAVKVPKSHPRQQRAG